MGCLAQLILLPIQLILLPFKLIAGVFESGNKAIDATLGRTKCPRCRSANVMRNGYRWHCNDCGRNFR